MSENILEIPRNYSDGTDLTEAILDEILDPIETYAGINNKNLKQIYLDAFGAEYALDNDGVANLETPLLDLIKSPTFFLWQEDFIESAGTLTASVNAGLYLGAALVGTAGAAILSNTKNGVLRLSTGATISSTATVSTLQQFLDTLGQFSVEIRFKIDSLAAIKAEAGVATDDNNYYILRYDSSTGIPQFVIASRQDGGIETATITGITVAANTYYVVKVSISESGSAIMTVDGSVVSSAHAGGVSSSATLRPVMFIKNLLAANKNMDVDYVRVYQLRNE